MQEMPVYWCLKLFEMYFDQGRWWLLRVLGRILAAPFFIVKFADFWLADQLTSMTIAILDLYNMLCYFASSQVCRSCVKVVTILLSFCVHFRLIALI